MAILGQFAARFVTGTKRDMRPNASTRRPPGRFVSRCITIVGLLAITASPLAAQGVLLGMLFGEQLASDKFNIGFEIGLNLPTVSGLDGASRSSGALFGLFASWRFSEHYHLYTALLPISSMGAKEANPIPLNDPQLDTLIGAGRMDRHLGYVNIPVLLQIAQHKDGGLRAGIGPQFGIRTSAHDRYAATTALGAHTVIENDISDEIERFDAGVAVDAEYRFSAIPLAIGLRYYEGLTDIAKGSGTALHNRVLSGSGRITLGGKPKKPPEPK